VAYAENFHGKGVSFSGIWWSFVFGVCCLRIHNLTSYSCLQTTILVKFVDIICIIFYTHSPYFINYQRSKLGYRRKMNSTLRQQFITAKIPGCALKQGSKAYSSLRQSNVQPQNEAALMSCRIRAVEHRKCAAGLPGAHPGLQDRILLNYTRSKNAHKVCKKTFNFL